MKTSDLETGAAYPIPPLSSSEPTATDFAVDIPLPPDAGNAFCEGAVAAYTDQPMKWWSNGLQPTTPASNPHSFQPCRRRRPMTMENNHFKKDRSLLPPPGRETAQAAKFRPVSGLLAALACSMTVSCAQHTPADKLAAAAATPITAEPSCTFWVATDGDDAANGSQKQPFRTLHRARDAVRGLGPNIESDVAVCLENGTHRLTEPLVLSPADSGRNGHDVIYRAAPGAHPVISGSTRVQRWERDPGLAGWLLGIWQATVEMPEAYQDRPSPRQLYVNERRAVRAQTESSDQQYPVGFRPTYGDYGQAAPHGGIEFVPSLLNPLEWADPHGWGNVRDIEAVIVTQWKMMSVPLESILKHKVPSKTVPGLDVGLITLRDTGWKNTQLYAGTKGKNEKTPQIWSFWQVTRFENAYEFLDQPGEWYLDKHKSRLYYKPRPGEDMATAQVELPILETLIQGQGTLEQPVSHLRFEGLTFAYATWRQPSTDEGYVADQSGFHVTGTGHTPNSIGHVRELERTPGNVSFSYAHHIHFTDNTFAHLGAVGLDFGAGSQHNTVVRNGFSDISSAAIQLGGVSSDDARPTPAQHTRDNEIANNTIHQVGRQYVDAAGIMVGFASDTTISHNDISDVPWSGIAIGWGWGLLDPLQPGDPGYPGTFPGLPGAVGGEWGSYTKPTINHGNKILNNRISDFVNVVWDGGAVYTTGFQGRSFADGLLIAGNTAFDKRPAGGSNIFYTDGGSRYVTLSGNASYDNPQGSVYLGPVPSLLDPLNPPLLTGDHTPSKLNGVIYGGEIGGCATYGDIHYEGNYWRNLWTLLPVAALIGVDAYEQFKHDPKFWRHPKLWPPAIKQFNPSHWPHNPLYYDPCRADKVDFQHPTRLTFKDNHIIRDKSEVPAKLRDNAGIVK